jgi:signal transduction histidine kinase/DNA-binding NarL/FixJ family response regulator
MKTILVLAQHPELADAVREALNPEQYRVTHRMVLEEAEPLLSAGVIDACIIDAELSQVQGLWTIEKLRERVPQCPLLVYTGSKQWEWEEEAYLQGVMHVLTKPLRRRVLNVLLERLWPKAGVTSALSLAPSVPMHPWPPQISRPTEVSPATSQALQVLRNFSGVLTHSLRAEALLRQFLLSLREIIGVNRAVIFLRRPFAMSGTMPIVEETRRLRSACAIGLSPGLLEHFELSFETGIGGYLFRQGRILRRESAVALADPEMQKEFELLGAQVAIPILDRENLVGVAAFDGRVTGEALTNNELELLFHLLEELGLAVKNIWLHDQVAANHEMLANILRELSSACVVISRDLTILHANKTARNYFSRPGHRSADLQFSDLPQVLGSKVYQVLRTGTGITPFKFHPADSPETIYHVTIVPFQRQASALPNSALLIVEDHTQAQQLQRLEVEAANLRLVKSMADRLTHEIGNALVPLSIHQQMLGEKYRDPEFRASLDAALADGVKRISRLTSQMRYLARDTVISKEAFPLAQLIEDAYEEAQRHQPVKSAKLKQESLSQPIILAGDRAALKHAMAEVILNALQANPSDAKVGIRARMETGGGDIPWVHVEVQDNGAGFTTEAMKKVPEPFFTTRNVGLGLGLTVAQKIIETHHGKLIIPTAQNGEHGLVRISLPLEAASAPKS